MSDLEAPPRWRSVALLPTPLTRGIAAIPNLAALLGAGRVRVHPPDRDAGEIDAVVGWGEKRNTARAQAWARRHRLPYWRAEDGFLRSIGLGVSGDPPLSIVLDDLGIYYDARRPSRLEQLLAGDGAADPALLERAARAMARIAAAGLSKYNDAPPGPVELGPPRRRVLVVDQTAGDLSVACGLADAGSFQAMLAAARSENPGAEIVVKTHPDVLAGKKRGYLEAPGGDRVRVWARPATPAALLAEVDRVYVVSSQLGFEALLAGKPVTCFGVPWYAGWGLTDDRAAAPEVWARRGRGRSREQLFAAAYLQYARYVDPDSGASCPLERVIDHLELQRAMFARNQGTIFCFGFRFWKRGYVRDYLRCPGNQVVFASDAADAERRGFDRNSRALVWGQREQAEVRGLAARHDVPLWRMEDGFLRSVGLGSDLATPASLVIDRQGIYYDPSGCSDLEAILQTAEFRPDELARVRALRDRIVDSRLSKYNVGGERRVVVPAGRRVVLVPGQVEDDASIRLGCRDIRTNRGLLEAARAASPGAYIIYKPHPDVLSGNRVGGVDRATALGLCDHVEEDATLALCLDVADEVHTMTSLVGFEALLRGRRVVVHGQPFYAGWGLTEDHNPHPRRTRRLTLDELCAGALLRYPRYLNRQTGRFTTPEVIITQLCDERDGSAAARTLKLSWPRRQLRKLVHAYRGVMQAR